MTPQPPPLNQIAFSVIDLRRTERWFRECFGFLPAGGSRAMMRGPMAARVQGLPKVASTCWWLVGRNPWFQLELFQFERPVARPLPIDFRPCDIGYTRIGLWVDDFEATLARLAAAGSEPLAAPLGAPGARRACVRSPDGVYVEIMEDDPLAGTSVRASCPVAVRSVTLSVPDLDRSVTFFRKALGLADWPGELHAADHESAWGLGGARVRSKTLLAGDVIVEIVQYDDPPGKPWPTGYRVSDQGILNVAFGSRSKEDHTLWCQKAVAAGGRPNWKPLHGPGGGVVYVNDPDGFSVELLYMRPGKADRAWGFEPLPIERRPAPDTHSVEASVVISAPPEKVWRIVTDQEGMSKWSGFDPVVVTIPGSVERNGYGSQRKMRGPIGSVQEEIVGWEPPAVCRYRVVHGSPFINHQGELRLAEHAGGTELTLTIRFRPRIRGTGFLFLALLRRMLPQALRERLKPLAEA